MAEETTEQLFLQCQFAKECWALQGITFQDDQNFVVVVDQIKQQSNPNFFMLIAILMCWAIWSVRNNFIFNNVQPEVLAAKAMFEKEMKLLTLRAKTRFAQTFDLWIQNLL